MNETRPVREGIHLFRRLYRAREAAVRGRDIDLIHYRTALVAEEKPVVDAIQRRGFDHIGVGAGRVVFRVPESDTVVKVARYGDTPADDGRWQNQNEWRTWNEAGDGLNLAPVCDADETGWSYVVMPEYEPLADVLADDPEQQSQLVTALQSQLLDAGVFVELLDIREANIGVDGESVVLFDYGASGTREY